MATEMFAVLTDHANQTQFYHLRRNQRCDGIRAWIALGDVDHSYKSNEDEMKDAISTNLDAMTTR